MLRFPHSGPSIRFQASSSGLGKSTLPVDYGQDSLNRDPQFCPLPPDPILQRQALIARAQILGLGSPGSFLSHYIDRLTRNLGKPLAHEETPESQLQQLPDANDKDILEFDRKLRRIACLPTRDRSNAEPEDLQRQERFYIRLPDFGRDPEWATMMNQLTTETREKLEKQECSSAHQVLNEIASEYHDFYERYPMKQKWSWTIFDFEPRENLYGIERGENEYADTFISESGRYGSYLGKVLSYLGEDLSLAYQQYKEPRTSRGDEFSRLIVSLAEGKTATLQLKGHSIELTKTKLDVIERTLKWYQPPLGQNKKILLDYLNRIYQNTIQYDKNALTPEDKSTIIHNVAKMHWLLAHMMLYKRGTAAITDIFTKVIFDYYGIETPRWRECISPDLEAFTRSEEDFINQYPKAFFEVPLLH